MNIFYGLYGLFLLAGAYFGLKAGSRVSLIMGIVSSLAVFLGMYILSQNPFNGYCYLSGVISFLCVVFLMRLIKTKKFMPGGMLFCISSLTLMITIFQLNQIANS